MFHFSEPIREWFALPTVWISQHGIGSVNIGSSQWPFFSMYGLLGHFYDNSALIDKIVVLTPLVVFFPVGIYLLSLHITKSIGGSFVSSLIFCLNTYLILGRTGHLTLMMSFALAPLGLLLFIKTIQEKKLCLGVVTGLLFFLIGSYEIRGFYIFIWVCFFYYLWRMFIVDRPTIKSVIRTSLFASIPVILFLLLNSYWILGLSKLDVISNNSIFSRGLFGDGYMNIREALTLFHPFWTGAKLEMFVVQPIPLHFYLIPIFASLGFWLNRKNKQILFFGIIALFGVFLSKQSSQPFPEAYQWLYDNLPGFNAFREASKFYFLIALGYSVLIGSFVSWLFNKWKSGYFQVVGKYVLIAIIGIMFLWNGKSVFTGEIGTLFVSRHIPQDYIILKDYLTKQDDFFRTFWVPTHSRWSIYTNNHPKVGFVDMFLSDWRPLIGDTGKKIQNTPGFEVMQDPKVSNLLTESSIKYVIIPLQDIENDDDFYIYYGERNKYVEVIDQLAYLKKIDIGMEDMLIYENSSYRPHIYLSDRQSEEKTTSAVLDYKQINPTEYRISIRNLSNEQEIVFTDSYHPGWQITGGEKSWSDWLSSKGQVLPGHTHNKTPYGLNSFSLDPQSVRDSVSSDKYSVNADGSIDIDLTLYFAPQSYFYLGSIVSLTTLSVSVIYLLLLGLKKLFKVRYK
jgi:hypothetical protein